MTSPQTTSRSRRCPTCGRTPKRSTDANARYWQLLSRVSEQHSVEGERYSAETWHKQCKKYWLGMVDERLPDGEVITLPASSAELEPGEFGEYMDKVEAWAAARGVFLDE